MIDEPWKEVVITSAGAYGATGENASEGHGIGGVAASREEEDTCIVDED